MTPSRELVEAAKRVLLAEEALADAQADYNNAIQFTSRTHDAYGNAIRWDIAYAQAREEM